MGLGPHLFLLPGCYVLFKADKFLYNKKRKYHIQKFKFFLDILNLIFELHVHHFAVSDSISAIIDFMLHAKTTQTYLECKRGRKKAMMMKEEKKKELILKILVKVKGQVRDRLETNTGHKNRIEAL